MSISILEYSANPADFPEYPDPCDGGGNHDWQRINPFTTNPILQRCIGPDMHHCEKCRQIARIPRSAKEVEV